MGNRPLLPATPDHFLASGRPGAALPGPGAKMARVNEMFLLSEKPAQVGPVEGLAAAGIFVVAAAEIHAAGHIPGAPGPASIAGRGGRQIPPVVRRNAPDACRCSGLTAPAGQRARSPIHIPVTHRTAYAGLIIPGVRWQSGPVGGKSGEATPIRANQAAHLPAARAIGIAGGSADLESFDPLNPPLFLPGKLKNAIPAYSGNARFPLGQPALLRRQKAPELAAFPEIDGVIPLVTVFAGRPSFRLAKGVGLVNAAVEGLAPVLRQGLEDGGSAILVGKGLPVGAVPGDRPALRRGCPPPPLRSLKGIGQGRLRFCGGTWQFPRG